LAVRRWSLAKSTCSPPNSELKAPSQRPTTNGQRRFRPVTRGQGRTISQPSRICHQCEIQWIPRHENEFSSREISVSRSADEYITCRSCDFRYPHSRGLCVMCGAPAQTTASAKTTTELAPEPAASPRSQAAIFDTVSPPVESQGRGKSIWIGIAVAVVLLVPLFLVIHNWQLSQSTGPVAATTDHSTQTPATPVAAPVLATKRPAKKVHTPIPAPQPVETVASPTSDSPTELWKSVRSGDSRAEVTLAKLYLDGNSVPQSCEQTHMLLLAASKKGSKAADNLLSGAYVERCQNASVQ
jgi:hypothetical protein